MEPKVTVIDNILYQASVQQAIDAYGKKIYMLHVRDKYKAKALTEELRTLGYTINLTVNYVILLSKVRAELEGNYLKLYRDD